MVPIATTALLLGSYSKINHRWRNTIHTPIDYLVIGHVTKDLLPSGPALGGTCSYSGLTAHNLGKRVGAVTSFGLDHPDLSELAALEIHARPSEKTTTYVNLAVNQARIQKWHSSAEVLTLQDVPNAWRSAPIVHLAPVAQEMSPALGGHFPDSLVCATGQGWLRGKDQNAAVIYDPHPDLDRHLGTLDVLVLSLDDVVGDQEQLTQYLTSVEIGVETMGEQGCKVYSQNCTWKISIEPVVAKDTTGAGDIFAAAFFIHYQKVKDPLEAAHFANLCASLSVSEIGLRSVPKLVEIDDRWQYLVLR